MTSLDRLPTYHGGFVTNDRYSEATGRPIPGFRWCPACNGEGVVTVMDRTPNLDETSHDCDYPGCADGQGIVPEVAE